MSGNAAYNIVKLILLVLVVLLFTMGYSIFTAYESRKDLVASQRGGCERSKLDRQANALGWRAAQVARMNSLATSMDIPYTAVEAMIIKEPDPDDPSDLVAARQYDHISSGLEKRSKINCDEAFPKASLIP